MKISKEARAEFKSWINSLEEGDCVRICRGEAVITNSFGCDINRFYLNEN